MVMALQASLAALLCNNSHSDVCDRVSAPDESKALFVFAALFPTETVSKVRTAENGRTIRS